MTIGLNETLNGLDARTLEEALAAQLQAELAQHTQRATQAASQASQQVPGSRRCPSPDVRPRPHSFRLCLTSPR